MLYYVINTPVIKSRPKEVPLKIVILGQGNVFLVEFAIICYLVIQLGFQIESVCAYDPDCKTDVLYSLIRDVVVFSQQHRHTYSPVYAELARKIHFFSDQETFLRETSLVIDIILGLNLIVTIHNPLIGTPQKGFSFYERELFYAVRVYNFLKRLLYPDHKVSQLVPKTTQHTPSYNFTSDVGNLMERLPRIGDNFIFSLYTKYVNILRGVKQHLSLIRFDSKKGEYTEEDLFALL